MNKRNLHQSQPETVGSSKKLFWFIGLIILTVVAFSSYKFMVKPSADAAKEVLSVSGIQKKTIDPSTLTGRWLRPDGGYVLQLDDMGSNGRMRAQYFNPRPINVSFAQWKEKDGRLSVFVELRDINYPGSTYTLEYDSSSDRMRGIYFQAAMQQQFEVEFLRIK